MVDTIAFIQDDTDQSVGTSLSVGEGRINTPSVASKFSKSGYETRARIIEAARSLIGEQGYEAMTASALVEKAGVSKGGLYHHFDRLTDVIVAVYEQSEFELYGSLAKSDPGSFDEYMDDVESMVFDHLLNSPEKMRIMFELMPKIIFDPAFATQRRIGLDHGIESMCEKLQPVCGDHISRQDLKATLKSISIFVHGLAAQSATFQQDDDSRAVWARFRQQTCMQLQGPVASLAARSGGAD